MDSPAPAARAILSREETVFAALLVFVPITVIAAHTGLPAGLEFFASVLAIVPLAGFIGSATEALADRIGGRAGGLLNATFGNAPELFVGLFGVQKGLIVLVKASLVGALISNSALVMGLACLLAGLRHGRPRFRLHEAANHSVLMLLSVAAVLFPSVGAAVACGPGARCSGTAAAGPVLAASVGISVSLLLAYAAYILFGIFGFERLGGAGGNGDEARSLQARSAGRARWPAWLSLSVLLTSTLLLIPVVDALTGTVEAVTRVTGWSDVFVGIVIVANAGNAAEAYSAIRMALVRPPQPSALTDSGLDLALGIASAASIQIAAFVAPIIVIFSLFQHPMDLSFSLVEVAILALVTLLFNYVAQDGESNWLEGFQLLVLYAMAAIVFYELPVGLFGG